MPSQAHNRDMKATAIEQQLVEMGYFRIPSPEVLREAARRVGYSTVSKDTRDRIEEFLADRFPNA